MEGNSIMNMAKVDMLLEFYKNHFYDIQEQELYKWEAMQQFYRTWDIEAEDFALMLDTALSKCGNLLVSSRYNALKGILMAANKDAESTRQLFCDLLDESHAVAVEKRILNFKNSVKEILHTCNKYNEMYKQDVRAIVLYLTMQYPNRYYLYKCDMLKNFASFIEYGDIQGNDIQRVLTYFKICEELRQKVIQDIELMNLYQTRQKEYREDECHMLVQDIIYSVYYYQSPNKLKKESLKRYFEKALDESYSDEEREEHARRIGWESLEYIAKNQKNTIPRKKEVPASEQMIRNPYVAEYAKRKANGICQLCMRQAPFNKPNGDPYLESHHIIWLSKGGNDAIENTVALCPNCHRKMHIVDDLEDVQKLKNLVKSL